MAMDTKVQSVYPSAHDASDYSYNSLDNEANAVGKGVDNSSYCSINLSKGTYATSHVYFPMSVPALPYYASIKSVTCQVKIASSSSSSSNIADAQVQLYRGGTAISDTVAFDNNTTATVYTLNLTESAWTSDNLSNLRLRIYGKRGILGIFNTRSILFYGATLTVTYEVPSGDIFQVKTGGTWGLATVYQKVNGVWVDKTEVSSTLFDANKKYVKRWTPHILNSNSWEFIREISDKDEGANYWAVGDTKTIVINGTVGATTFNNLSIDAYIIGFNHNSAVEGEHKIHFKLGKINGVQVGLVDSSYNRATTASGKFTMNTSNTNSGGWNGCHMRKTVLGSDSTPTSPTANTLLAALPADLRVVMKPITKYTDNTGNSSNSSGNVTATTDYLPLLAEFEVFGSRGYANSAEKNYQVQYDCYKAGNAKTHYKHNATDTAAWVWLRSANCNISGYFLIIGPDGSVSHNSATASQAVAPGFAVSSS